MMKLLCEENNLEYTGSGYLQCGRHVECPKKKNNKILGFDCLLYIDNLPDGCKIDIPEQEHVSGNIMVHVHDDSGHVVANKPAIQIIPASEQVVPGVK